VVGIFLARKNLNNMKKDWKTTLAGVLTILGSLCTAGLLFLKGQQVAAIGTLTTGVPAGIGLIKASDASK
jgi:hypothetical protein